MPQWFASLGLSAELPDKERSELERLQPIRLPAKSILFHPGDTARGFVVLLQGQINVYLTGKGGRELLLYSVTPGETCLQTTLGLLGEAPYSGEGVAETDVEGRVIPPPLFLRLMGLSEGFRTFVFRAFATRLSDAFFVLEQVAFVKVEARLARELLQRSRSGKVIEATHHELAVAIGSAREVVSRRLEAMSSRGWVTVDRGSITVIDPVMLEQVADGDTRHPR